MKTTILHITLSISAIVTITLITILAILRGVDGQLLYFSITSIAGLAGYHVKKLSEPSK